MHREKVSRREIGIFTAVRRLPRGPKISAPAAPPEPCPPYSRRPISYQELDGLGHGVKVPRRLRPAVNHLNAVAHFFFASRNNTRVSVYANRMWLLLQPAISCSRWHAHILPTHISLSFLKSSLTLRGNTHVLLRTCTRIHSLTCTQLGERGKIFFFPLEFVAVYCCRRLSLH